MTDFSSLNLAEPVAKAVAAEGYSTPTPIQTLAIPPALEGRDLFGIAQTGTGKTAAFALPALSHLARHPQGLKAGAARVLVLAPTRELALQIAQSFEVYGRNLRLSVAVVMGGAPINRQVRSLQRGVDVLVATPGRLIDLIDRKALKLSMTEIVVLDEADQMLDLGFIHSLRKIFPLLPAQRQTMLFSATMPKSIAELARDYLNDPVKVSVAPAATTAERVDQRVTFVRKADKPALLRNTLSAGDIDRALVFTRTKHGADKVVRQLDKAGIRAAAIHGNKSQPQRVRALDAFRDGRCRILVATDIAARGLDIDGVSHVVNYEIPNVPEQYVHRIGRTARAGAQGVAISFVDGEERAYLKSIEKLTRIKIPVEAAPEGIAAPETDKVADKRDTPSKPKPKRGRNRRRRPAAKQRHRGDQRGSAAA
ncbi:MAG: DEAD/DEAH box helicase [Parvularculaceae bacterium]|nr:DEAD/DEAH box helicase [Parvularculaceae bacterium]